MDSPLLSDAPSPAPTAGVQQTPNTQPKSLETPPDFCARGLSRTPPRTQPEQLPCPRCDSSNTKFCYYNNYNLSQPRHFCKSCRRYWTRGGALRNVPVGGGTRKSTSTSSKRPRRKIAAVSKNDRIPVPSGGDVGAAGRAQTLDPDPERGSVGCFWSNEEMGSGSGDFPFNGYVLGPGPDYEQASLDWPVEKDGGPLAVADEPGFGTWQIGGGGDGGALESDCFTWPDLAISTPAEALK